MAVVLARFPCHAAWQVLIAGNHELTFDGASYPSTWRRFGHPRARLGGIRLNAF